MAGVLLIVEASGEQLAPTAAELVAAGARVAGALAAGGAEAPGAGQPVVLLAGQNVQGLATALGGLGVERVLVADAGAAEGPAGGSPVPPSTAWLLAAARQAAQHVQPDVVLLTHAGAGRELGPALAFGLGGGVVTDATALRVEGGDLVITKPVYGGSAVAEYVVDRAPRVVSLRPRAFEANPSPAAVEARVEGLQVVEPDQAVEVLEEVREQVASGPRLKDSRIVVSGGRGVGGPENWHYVEELAQVLGAAVGATRAVTDAGWVPPSLQVGLTGATIAPDLYVTIGISGAVQHIAGISGARNVVAINRDADANIFKYARFGVVGDWKAIVPALTQRLKELRA